jgi:hypothetical protein
VAIVLSSRVARDLVHRLADADGGGEVHDAIDALERAVGELAVADVADDQLDAVRQLGRVPPWTCSSRLSSTTTSSPRSTSARTRCEPMKPAPPVTSVLM